MDLDFQTDNNRFNARVSAIIYNKSKDKVLLFSMKDRNYYMLPGGRIEFGENSKDAFTKEIRAELDNLIKMENLIAEIDFHFAKARYAVKIQAVEPNISVNKIVKIDLMRHPLLIGRVEKIIENDFVCKDNDNQLFHWIDIDELNEFEVYPQATINLIKDKNDRIVHLIERKEEK